VVAETCAETPDSPDPSLHDKRRVRLCDVHERHDRVWFTPPQ
jgi:hypothetical protein